MIKETTRVELICPNCKKSFEVKKYRTITGNVLCCSRSCATTVRLTGKKKGPHKEETKRKLSEKLKAMYSDERNHTQWKGDKVGYFGVHDWMTKHYGQPVGCEVCGLDDPNRKYYWANLSGEYQRSREDFKRMCGSCHRKYDGFSGPEWGEKVREYMLNKRT